MRVHFADLWGGKDVKESRKLLKRLVVPSGLEPLTSTVSRYGRAVIGRNWSEPTERDAPVPRESNRL